MFINPIHQNEFRSTTLCQPLLCRKTRNRLVRISLCIPSRRRVVYFHWSDRTKKKKKNRVEKNIYLSILRRIIDRRFRVSEWAVRRSRLISISYDEIRRSLFQSHVTETKPICRDARTRPRDRRLSPCPCVIGRSDRRPEKNQKASSARNRDIVVPTRGPVSSVGNR